jgi:hypothetical protein
MATINTDIIDSFTSGARIRTLNYRGSLVSTIAKMPNKIDAFAVNDVLMLCPIPYRAIIRSLRIGGGYSAATTQAKFALTIFGINPDGKTPGAEIGFQTAISDIYTTANAPLLTEKATQALTNDTLICNLGTFDGNGRFVPKAEFVPYAKDRCGLLALECTTAAAGTVTAGTITVVVDFVEPAPSEGPFMKTLGLTPKTV